MQAQFDAWSRSSHHHVAVCNDCHTPKALVGKYWTNEAENSTGFHAPQEDARILAKAIDLARQGQLALRGPIPARP
jgi:formate-dependent nitrite reductase cytochrome c552 subunit